jgi:hypothetical protein
MLIRLDALTPEQLRQAHINAGFKWGKKSVLARIISVHPTDITGQEWDYEVRLVYTNSKQPAETVHMLVEFDAKKMAFVAMFA